jgi:hypothetical protein
MRKGRKLAKAAPTVDMLSDGEISGRAGGLKFPKWEKHKPTAALGQASK